MEYKNLQLISIPLCFVGKLREDMCGYEETTVLPDPIESRPINQGDLVDITYPTPPDPVIEKKIIGGKHWLRSLLAVELLSCFL